MVRHALFQAAAVLSVTAAVVVTNGCQKQAPPPPQMQAMPVQVQNVALNPVPRSDEYVATIKSRRSATIQPQVDGNITKIYVKSGDHVKAGQPLMEIDPLRQRTAVESQQYTADQKKALYEYNQGELARQKALYESGVTSKQTYDQALQSFQNSKADYDANVASTHNQQQLLRYYRLTAPFDGIVGDVPTHLGDYVSPTTVLTTVDQMDDLEVYIYVPTDRTSDIHMGTPVEIVDNAGQLLQESKIDFISPQVDNSLQGILVKAPVRSDNGKFRSQQLVKARVVWATDSAPTIPVLAVSRINGQAFVMVAQQKGDGYVAQQKLVQLGDTVNNNYVVKSGLAPGDKVIVSGLQLLAPGAPVKPLG